MGYYTYYTLQVDPEEKISSIIETLQTNPILYEDTSLYGYALDWDNVYGNTIPTLDTAKWYEHDVEMVALSKVFPDVVFTLEGQGEEADDKWCTRYYNGELETVHAEVHWPEFSPLQIIETKKPEIELGD